MPPPMNQLANRLRAFVAAAAYYVVNAMDANYMSTMPSRFSSFTDLAPP